MRLARGNEVGPIGKLLLTLVDVTAHPLGPVDGVGDAARVLQGLQQKELALGFGLFLPGILHSLGVLQIHIVPPPSIEQIYHAARTCASASVLRSPHAPLAPDCPVPRPVSADPTPPDDAARKLIANERAKLRDIARPEGDN